MARSFDTYDNSQIVPSIVVALLFGAVTVVYLILLCVCYRKRGLRWLSYHAAKVSLQDTLNKTDAEDEKKETYTLFNIEISFLDIAFAAAGAPAIVSMVLITFWSVFLRVNTTFRCDEDMDCYGFNETTNEVIQEPLENCSNFALSSNSTVKCFKFVFTFAEAFGVAGGVIALAPLIAKFYIGAVLAIVIGKRKEKGEEEVAKQWTCEKCCRLAIYYTVVLLIPTSISIGGAIIPLLNLYQDNIILFESAESFIMYYSYFLTWTWTYFLSNRLIYVIYRRAKRRQTEDSQYEYRLMI